MGSPLHPEPAGLGQHPRRAGNMGALLDLRLVGAFGVKALVVRHSPRFWGAPRGIGGSQDPWENWEAEEGVRGDTCLGCLG